MSNTMAPDSSLDNPSLPHGSNWHSIRPWAPSLTLAVREITSVSATFILSSTLSGELNSSLASLGLEAAEEASENAQDPSNANGTPLMSAQRKNNPVIADALSKGLSVNVNGSAWQRAFIRIDEQLDEAVIIIYALMPGRQYDIELGLASAGQTGTIHRQVTTEEDSDQDATENNTDPESPTADNSTSSSDPHSTPSTSPSRTVPGTPPAAAPQVTLEDRISQLQLTLSQVNAEQEGLVASLKSVRKESQKADAALRSEIDTLKKTSEKNAATELRRNQKLLQLQEAVKQAHKSAETMEKEELELRAEFPELNAAKDKKEEEYAKVKLEAERARKEREDVEEKERKRLDAMRAELAGLTNKLEKLGVKTEKLEKTVIPDLEEKMEEVSKEIKAKELEIAKMEEEETQLGIQNDFLRSINNESLFDDSSATHSSYVPMQRVRQHPSTDKPAPIGRPSPLPPIQRPPHFDNPPLANSSLGSSHSTSSNPLWSPTIGSRQPQSHPHHGQNHSHNPHSQSFSALNGQNHSAPMLPLKMPRRGSLKSNPNGSAPSISTTANLSSNHYSSLSGSTHTSTSSPTSSSINSSPTRSSPAISAATSTLSSCAPAFEPSRSILNRNGHFYGNGSPSSNTAPTPPGLTKSNVGMPVQRPRETSVGSNRPSTTSTGSKTSPHVYPHWSAVHGSGNANSGFDNSR